MSAHDISEKGPASNVVDRAWRLQFIDLAEARNVAEAAVALARAEDNLSVLGHAYFQVAYAALRRGSPDEARPAIDQSLAIFASLDDRRGAWLARVAEALYARSFGNVTDALDTLLALEVSPPSTATASDLFIVDTALGMSYRFGGQLESALKWHYRAVDSARESKEPQLLAAALCNLGGYHADLFNPAEACRLLEQALACSQACNARRTTALIALNLVQSFTAQNLHKQAAQFADTHLKSGLDGMVDGYADLSTNLTLALAYANVGRVDDAVQAFERTKGHGVTPTDEGTPQVFWTYVEARVAMVSGAPARVIDVAQAMFAEIDEEAVNSPADLMHLHATVAQAYEALGDGYGALFHERRRASIREGLVHRAMHVASIVHGIESELEATRTERDRILKQHGELAREHEKLASLNTALNVQIAENLRLHDELKEQNYRDALTGLNNRRFLYDHAPQLLAFNLSHDVPLCLAMLDVDFFKKINDRYGHGVGDHVLAGLGKLLRGSLRENDIVCRIGGEEFAMILPASHAFVARDRLQKVLVAFGQMKPHAGEPELPLDLTFSAGIVECPENGSSIDELLISADKLLYKAKSDGRARIEVADNGFRVMANVRVPTRAAFSEKVVKEKPDRRRH